MSLPCVPNLVDVSLQLCDCLDKDKDLLWESGLKYEDNTAVYLQGTGYTVVEWLEVARYYVTSGFFFFWLRLGAKR
jgi:hypothetical protein